MSEAKRILLVDDDAAFTESNKDLLEACGYEVYTATDGTEGLALAVQVKPDLMILDVMMTSDTEGFEVARRIHETPELRGMKVLLVTGMAAALNLPHAPKRDETWLPVDRVLEKPIDPGRLLVEVRRLIDGEEKGSE